MEPGAVPEGADAGLFVFRACGWKRKGTALSDPIVSLEVVERVCAPCAAQMRRLGWRALKVSALSDAAVVKAFSEAMCDAIGGSDPGFFTRCLDKARGFEGVDDPEAFCAALHKFCTGQTPAEEHAGEKARKGLRGIVKIDEEQRRVFGFAMVSTTRDGKLMVDLDGDTIEPGVLEEAAYDFVRNSREATVMHSGRPVGTMVESVVFTPDKVAKMGLRPGALPSAWWVGFELEPEVFAKVKAGQYRMFSIEGVAEREEAEVTA